MADLRASILQRGFREAELFADKLCCTLTNRWTLAAVAVWLTFCVVGAAWGVVPA